MTKSLYKRITVVILLILGVSRGVSVVDHYADDDHVVEHKVSYKEAIAAAKKLQLSKDAIPGCKRCSYEEMTYCSDGSIINDHCCCDTGDNRLFPFVEHTCLVGRQACTVIAADCAEYERLRECCCHAYLGSLWKYRAGGGGTLNPSVLFIFLVTLMSIFNLL